MSSLQHLLKRCSILPKFQGLFPFYIPENGEITLSKRWLFWSIIMHLAQIIGACYLTIKFSNPYRFENIISEWLYICQILAFQGSLAIHFIWILFNKKYLKKAIKNLVEISKEVPFNGKVCFWYQQILLVNLLILLAVRIYMSDQPSSEITIGFIYSLTANYFQAIFNCVAVIQFTNFLIIFRGVFKATTASIREQPVLLGNNLEKLLDKHDRLISACEEVNHCFGPLLLISLITYFEIVTANFYYLYYHRRAETILIGGVWIFTFLELNRYLIYYSTLTVDAANEFYNELYRVAVIEDSNHRIPKGNLHHFFIIKRELRITASRCFNIDYKFYCSMIATCVTYIVIFIQFKGLAENNRYDTTC